jgi:hypothetical protein
VADQIYDPQTGERITFLDGQRGPDQPLRLEFVLDPGGLVPGLHVHPHQEERFRLVEGAFFETLFAWINQGKGRGGIITNPLRAAVLARTYRDEIQFPPQRAIPITRLPGCRATPPDRTRAR